MKVRFHPAAEAEHLEQIAFYESRERGLGARYLDRFNVVLSQVCAAPASMPIVRPPDIRRARVRPFPLTIMFRERNGEVQIIAVAHHRREPHYWQVRT